MKANMIDVKSFFGRSNIQFVIPLFQREYQWSKEIKILLEDFYDILDKKNKRHFIGSILFKNCIRSDDDIIEKDLVDGQQRTTTLFLFFVVLRKIAKEKKNNFIYQQLTSFFIENDNDNGGNKIKFKPVLNHKEVFELIMNDKITFSEEEDGIYKSNLYYNSYKIIYKELQKWTEKYTVDEILEMLASIYLVPIEINERDQIDIQKVFESINSTGVILGNFDLIRNYLLMGLSSQMQEKLYKKWEDYEKILDDLEQELIVKRDQFLLAYLQLKSKKYERIKEEEIYKAYKKFAQESHLTSELLLEDLLWYIKIYRKIYDIRLEENPNIITYTNFFKFDAGKNTSYASFLMKIFDLHIKGKLTDNEFQMSMKLIDNYVLRRKLLRFNANSMSRFFCVTLLWKLNHRPENQTVIDFLKTELYENTKNTSFYVPDDEEIITRYSENFNASSISIIKFLLYIVETWDKYDSLNFEEMTKEHIMPSKPKDFDFWMKAAGVDKRDKYFNVIQRLGNLTLVSQKLNSALSNSDWFEKKQLFEDQSRVIMNQKLANLEKFDLNEINIREKEILNRVFEIFNQEAI